MKKSNGVHRNMPQRVRNQRGQIPARLVQLMGGRSQGHWAKELGVPQQNISRYVHGQATHVEFLIHVANREGVNLNWLVLGEGRKFRQGA